MKYAVVALAAFSGCGAQLVKYTPAQISPDRARAVIEQAYMEQPASVRPQDVLFGPEYILIAQGYVTSGKQKGIGIPLSSGITLDSGSSEQLSRELGTRLYYTSLGVPKLYQRSDRCVVFVVNRDGALIQKVYISNRDMARQFVDAVASFRQTP